MAPPSDAILARYHEWITKRPLLVLVLAGLLGAAGIFLAQRLELRTAISELLPSDDPGVVALTKTQQRIGDLSLLLIGIRSPDPAANVRYAKALTEKLRTLPPKVIALATYNVSDLRTFFEHNKWLYVSEPDLESIRDRLRSEINRRKNPLYVSLGEDESLDSLQKRVKGGGGSGLDSRFPNGLFSSNNGQYVWIAALPPGGLFVERAGEGLLKAAKALIAEDPPSRHHPEMRADFSGPVTTAIAERQAVERDIIWVTTTCLILVGLSIGFYFRRLRAIPLTGVPAVLGTIAAFATAELAFGHLNSSTAFLGSIILGNGINYAIVLMSRYEEYRGEGRRSSEALRLALGGVWKGTLVASISASLAYASLMVTSFRGFYQFGVMGAVGVIYSWLATFTVLPAMLILLDRKRTGGPVGRPPIEFQGLARFLRAHSLKVIVGGGLLTAVSVYGLTHFLQDPFEYDFRKLNAKIPTTEERKEFNRSFNQIFGRWPSPTIVLADSIDEVETVRATIRRQDQAAPGSDVIGQIATIYDLLPGPPDVQQRKLTLIAQIRKMTQDPALEVLDETERRQLAQVDPPADLRVLGAMDLPPIARRPFTEVDGTVGRVILVYPPESGISVWSGKDLLRIAGVLQRLDLPGGKVLETSGSAVVFGAMIRSVLHDGPIATIASLIAVLLVVSFTIRPARAALLTLGTLILGVLWMVGGAGIVGVRVTFLNFIALPITFGIGVEYAVNVVVRYREERNILKAILSTGGAVALCSWTTILGYGSLLAARNQSLQGFGAMAILGEVACLLTAIIALPALLLWRRAQPLEPTAKS